MPETKGKINGFKICLLGREIHEILVDMKSGWKRRIAKGCVRKSDSYRSNDSDSVISTINVVSISSVVFTEGIYKEYDDFSVYSFYMGA